MYIEHTIVRLLYITVTKASVTRTPIKKLTFKHGAVYQAQYSVFDVHIHLHYSARSMHIESRLMSLLHITVTKISFLISVRVFYLPLGDVY